MTRTHGKRKSLLMSATAFTLVALSLSPAQAQAVTKAAPSAQDNADGHASPEVASADIVVTATKRDTKLQETPIAVTALSAASLETANVDDVRDLDVTTPGLNFAAVNGIEVPITLRGIASGGLGLGGDSPTAVYLDGVYLAQPHAATFALADIERIEVLRGPQGTLYGQNSTAGAIKIITTTPDNNTKVRGSVEVGSFDRMEFKGAFSGPVIEDKIYAKIAGAHNEDSGFYRNFYTGRKARKTSETTISGALRLTPTDSLDIVARGDWNKSSIPPVRQLLFSSVATDAPPVPCPLAKCELTFTNGTPDPTQRFKNFGGSLTARLDLGAATISSITAYREQHWFFLIDNSYLQAQLFPVQNVQDERQFTQEFNVASSGDGPFQWVIGAFYMKEHGESFVPLRFVNTLLVPDVNADGVADNLQITTWSTTGQKAYAFYGEGNYQLTDRMKVTAGLRYGHSEKTLVKDSRTQILLSPQAPIIEGFLNIPPRSSAPAANHRDLSASWKYLIPRLIVDYKIADRIFAYGSVSRGFKNGGFDFVSTNPGPFNPEKLWTYELGLKSEFFDRRVLLNLAAFHSDYKGLQLTTQDALGNRVTSNAANSTIDGIELEYGLKPISGLDISGFATYTKSKFKNFVTDVSGLGLDTAANCIGGTPDLAAKTCDFSGNSTPLTPKFTFVANVSYDIPVGELGTLTPRITYSYRSKTFFSYQNVFPAGFEKDETLAARLTFTTEDRRWAFSVFGNNLTNERHVDGAGTANISRSNNPLDPLPTGARRIIGTINSPRTFGLQASFNM